MLTFRVLLQAARPSLRWPVQFQVRTYSQVKTKPISKNFELRTVDGAGEPGKKPLVLLFAWLMAKRNHVKKYSDFYLGKGFDVLSINIEPKQVMWPVTAQKTLYRIIDYVREDRFKNQPILLHCFSVGGYLYGELLVKMKTNPDKYRDISERLVAQILDSPVDFPGIPYGVPTSLTKNKIAQKIMETILYYYLDTFKEQTTDHFLRSSDAFRSNELRLPSLYLYSYDDPVGRAAPIEELIDEWRNRGLTVYQKAWESSPHASHMMVHPEEYMQELNKFLSKVDLDLPQVEKIEDIVTKKL